MCPWDTDAPAKSYVRKTGTWYVTSMKVAYTIQLMVLKLHTKFQIIPISCFRVLADENFSYIQKLSLSLVNRKLICDIHESRTHDTTHDAKATYKISNHSHKRFLSFS